MFNGVCRQGPSAKNCIAFHFVYGGVSVWGGGGVRPVEHGCLCYGFFFFFFFFCGCGCVVVMTVGVWCVVEA